MTKRNVFFGLVIFAVVVLLYVLNNHARAADIYEGRGNIHKTPAMLSDVLAERTELNTYINGNSKGVASNAGRITVLEGSQKQQDALIANKVDRTEFVKDQARQDANNKAVAGRVDTAETAQKQQANTLTQHNKTLGNHTGRIESLETARNEYGTRLDNLDPAQTALNDKYASQLAGYQADLASVKEDVEQAKEGAAAALAVAGQQFCTDQVCGFQASVSAATMSGKQALAIGAGGAVSENVFINAAFTKAGNTQGGVVSGTYRFR